MSLERIAYVQAPKAKLGGAYYFKSWSPKTEEIPKRRVQYAPGKDGFTEWRNFMKEYLKENTEDDKPSHQSPSDTSIRHEDIAWTAQVVGARQVHMKKAREVAQAVSTSKELKSAKMFQQRFEISEKYALVNEPTESKQDKLDNQDLTDDEESKKCAAVEKQHAEDVNSTPCENNVDMCLHQKISSVQKVAGDFGYFVTPEPWRIKSEPIPPPSYKNFNRSPRGFVGSYLTSYY